MSTKDSQRRRKRGVKYLLQDLQAIARARGGKCLSDTYLNNHTKLTWQCAVGHKWQAIAGSVIGSKNQIGSWCPRCRQRSFGEKLCRLYFEHFFLSPFPSTRPPWLVGKKGKPLELDGYSERLQIAFEYQGPHHYKTIPFYRDSKKRLGRLLRDQKARDELKRALCKRQGVTLIEVPFSSRLSLNKLGESINNACKKHDLEIQNSDLSKIDFSSLWAPETVKQLNKAQTIARSKKGHLLSKAFVGSQSPLEWRCERGHTWTATLGKVAKGSWCSRCHFDARKQSIEEARALAERKNGRCLSKRYLDSRQPLRWECEVGHHWKTSFSKIRSGRWCPKCAKANRGAKQRESIQEIKKLAKSRGGHFVSSDYMNASTPLEWECKKGHRWLARTQSIKRGSWCPFCVGKNKTIQDAVALAEVRGGICLSKRYKNNRTPLRWKCKLGHSWKADFSNVKAGKWCPTCGIRKRSIGLRGNIEEMQKIARSRGGACLSREYVNANTPLKWLCAKGHKWMARAGHVKNNGTWCPLCAGRRK